MSEELKIIMETIAQLGQAGKEAFIWWLAVKYVVHYVTVILCIGILGFVATRIIAAIKGCQEECRLVAEIARKAGMTPSNYYDRSDYTKMYEWVRGAETPR